MSPSRRDALAQLAVLLGLPAWAIQAAESTIADEPLDGTIAGYQLGRARGVWSAEQVVRAALDRATTVRDHLRAIAVLAPDAIASARASDARARAGRLRGPLDGVPLFAKSIHDLRGLPTDASNAEWRRLFPDPVPRDAIEVAQLRAAGAVVLGKTAADDFAYGGVGLSTATGRVRNPYDAHDARTSGGSSAGSAVSVACGVVFGALGTDDGGSNRIPAQCCGIVGMKPTFGRVGRSGVLPTWPALDTHGPLARTAEDARVLFRVLDRTDRSDPFGPPTNRPIGDSRAERLSLRGRRFGLVSAHTPRTQMTAEAQQLFDRAIGDLRAHGAVLEEVELPVTLHTFRAAFAEAAASRGDVAPDPRAPATTARALLRYFAGRSPTPRDDFRRGYAAYRGYYDVLPADADAALALVDSAKIESAATASFLASRRVVVDRLAAAMRQDRVDALVYPTMPFAAFGADGVWPDVRTPLGFGNWLGLPEVSVPAGLGADGVPGLNLSFVGVPNTDRALLNMAVAFERATRRFVPPPPIR